MLYFLKIPKEDGTYQYGKSDVFALVIILKQFLSNDEFVNFCEEVDERIRNLDYNLKAIKVSKVLRHMGFPKNWKEISTVRKKVDNEE